MLAFWSADWTLGGIVLALVAGLCLRDRLARFGAMPRWAAFAYVAGIGIALAVTLSPRSPDDTYFVFGQTARRCQLPLGGLDLTRVVTSAEWQFNLLLLLPVGWACGATRNRRRRRWLLAAATAVPLGIELAQYLVTSLHRVCGGTDIVTNWLGLALGSALAGLFHRRAQRTSRSPHDDALVRSWRR